MARTTAAVFLGLLACAILLVSVTADKKCGECAAGAGPCRHNVDWTCHSYQDASKQECPAGTTPCNAVDCEMGPWSEWGKCSSVCGGGKRTRTRWIKLWPQNGGAACPVSQEWQDCNTHSCKKDTCEVSAWGPWSKCSAKCDGGSQTRWRSVLKGWKDCPTTSESRECNTNSCSTCAKCKAGTSGPCMHDTIGDNTCENYYKGTTVCPVGTTACKVTGDDSGNHDGKKSDGLCTDCFGTSKGSCQSASGVCHDLVKGVCPKDTTLCKPQHCVLSAWSKWSPCSAKCGGGSRSRVRYVVTEPSNGGVPCGHLSEKETCNKDACDSVCKSCAKKTSGPCQHLNDNSCMGFEIAPDGTWTCPVGTRECHPIDCIVSEWSNWGKCTKHCAGGSRFRHRYVVQKPSANGVQCPALQDSESCNKHPCNYCKGCAGGSEGPCYAASNGVCYGYYKKTGECPAGTTQCYKGVQVADVEEETGEAGDGMCSGCAGVSAGPCRHDNVNDNTCYAYATGTTCPVGTSPCKPVNCQVSAWSSWTKCSASCGGGKTSRSRVITVHPTNGGANCPHLSETNTCNKHSCKPKCSHCAAGTYGPCQHLNDFTCQGYKGNSCPPGTQECKVQDCVVSPWSSWGKCSATCNGGSQTRTRVVWKDPTPGAIQCPNLSEERSCNTHKCNHCVGCAGGTKGPCQQEKNFVCHGYYEGTTDCPAGTVECKDSKGNTFSALGDAAGDAGDGMCQNCFGNSYGPCRHNANPSCHAYVAGTKTCPVGTSPCKPLDCIVEAWSSWSKCSAPCDGGSTSRSRGVIRHPTNGGMKCPHLYESSACNTQKCHKKEIDCAVSDWSKWGQCSVTCGGGTYKRTRSVVVPPTKDGKACPALSETGSCNTHSCDSCVGCAGGTSGPCQHNANYVCHDYYEGTKTCPAGTTECKHTKKTWSVLGGLPGDGMCTNCDKTSGPCRHLNDNSCFAYMSGTTTCPPGTAPCQPVDCQVGGWSAWGACTKSCGGGSRTRYREIKVQPTNGGAACPSLSQKENCNTQKCLPTCTNCWGDTSGVCKHDKDGSCFPLDAKSGECPAGTTECKDVDCVVSQWGAWTKCTAKCGGGLQGRWRSVLTYPQGKGAACPALSESQTCNKHDCDSCAGCWAGTYGPCKHDKDTSCTGYFPGTQQCPPGTTACKVFANTLGLLDVKPGSGQCSDCFGDTSGPCRHDNDNSCYEAVWGYSGWECPVGTTACAPVNCQVSEWSKWAPCSKWCGGGSTTRSRTITVHPTHGGAECPDLVDYGSCNNQACPTVCADCAKDSSGPCQHIKDNTCFGYQKDKYGQDVCPPGTTECLPVDCAVSEWTAWGKCSANCNGGSQSRSRYVKVHPTHGGAACPHLSEDQTCNTHKCNHCHACAGLSSGPCRHDANYVCHAYNAGTTTCPAGTTECKEAKTFSIQGGKPGPSTCSACFGNTEGPCRHNADTSCFPWAGGVPGACPVGTHPCKPVSCEVTPWSAWTKCDADCGGGSQSRYRDIAVKPTDGGASCPALSEKRSCNTESCKATCAWCAPYKNEPCLDVKYQKCVSRDYKGECPWGAIPCSVPVDCEVGEWSKWSTCSSKCGGGKTTRSRSVKVEAANGGKACPALTESSVCNTHKCDWCTECGYATQGPCKHADGYCTNYLKDTTSCPPGTSACASTGKDAATLAVLDVPKGDALCRGCFGDSAGPCRHHKDSSCHSYYPGTTMCPPGTQRCKPIDCRVSEWSKWGFCSAPCGGGTRSRSRYVKVAPTDGGAACPALTDSIPCNEEECPIQCTDCSKDTAGPCQNGPGSKCVDWDPKADAAICPKGYEQCEVIDCVVGEWTNWGKCSAKCGGGLQHRSRPIVVAPENNGHVCPHLGETRSCNSHSCTLCAGCSGGTTGECRHLNDNTCFGYLKNSKTCAPGSSECAKDGTTVGHIGSEPGDGLCSWCKSGSKGPCRADDSSVCHAFIKGTTQCPKGTTACVPHNCAVSEWTAWSKCSADCDGGSRTRSRKVTTEPTNGGAKCPDTVDTEACNTHACPKPEPPAPTCGKCSNGDGPCRREKDDVCLHYYTGSKKQCPFGTEACELCDKCEGKTAGPCRHDKDGSCHAFAYGTVCPKDTTKCSGGVAPPASNDDKEPETDDKKPEEPTKWEMCKNCWPGTAGPCQAVNSVCYFFLPGKANVCPPGLHKCAATGSLPPLDVAVFDVHFVNDDRDADTIAADVAEASDRPETNVVVESDTPSDDGGRDIGFVVVPREDESAAAAASAVTGALSSGQVGAGFAGLNKPAQLSISATSTTAGAAGAAGQGMSSVAIALAAVGGVIAIALLGVGALLVSRRRAGAKTSTVASPSGLHLTSTKWGSGSSWGTRVTRSPNMSPVTPYKADMAMP